MFGEAQEQPTCYNGGTYQPVAPTVRKVRGRKSKIHDKIRLAKGNAFVPEMFGADGVVAFVNEGFTESSATYHEFMEHNNGMVKVALFQYNNELNGNPSLDQYAEIVAGALDGLAKGDAKVVVMPPLNGTGGTSEEKLNALEEGVASWLETHADSSIEKIYITTF